MCYDTHVSVTGLSWPSCFEDWWMDIPKILCFYFCTVNVHYGNSLEANLSPH